MIIINIVHKTTSGGWYGQQQYACTMHSSVPKPLQAPAKEYVSFPLEQHCIAAISTRQQHNSGRSSRSSRSQQTAQALPAANQKHHG
jgi:hypothetical protein